MCVAAPPDPASEMPFDQREIPGYPKTDFGWPVVPDGLRELLVLLDERYPGLPPVMITENGCSYNMGPDEHGVVDEVAGGGSDSLAPWGVGRGKELAKAISPGLEGGEEPKLPHDSSTNALIRRYRNMRRGV